MKNYFCLLLISFLITSCKEDASADAYSDEKIMSIEMPPKEDANYDVAAVDSTAAAVDEPSSNDSESSLEKIEPQIIKNGDLRFETDDLEKTYEIVQNAVKKNEGTIQNDNEGKDYQTHYRNLTIRVPSKNFDSFIKEISTGVNYFDRKEISSNDVTEEYIDVVSRIKTKKALEERYLELLKKATKVSEILEVERQLSEIREEIEAKEGRLKYIKNRVSMSTITLEIYKTDAEKSGATVSFGSKIINAIKSGFNGISSFFIWLIGIWPFIVILVAIIYFVRKRFKKKTKKDV
ncbi:DUF4349 domain-containing protein [Flavobacterium koreense]